MNASDGIFNPQRFCNDDPNRCVPGATVDLRAVWVGQDLRGPVTLDGTRFTDVGNGNSPDQMSVDFAGSGTLPPPPPGATVSITAPFTLTGNFTHGTPTGTVTETLTGTGTATLFLRYGYASYPNSYYIDRVLYVFGSTLPYPWVSADVGAAGQQGNAALSDGSFVIQGAGADIWGTADAFQFTSQVLDSDAEIVVRVTAEQNTDPFAKAGLMIRQNRDAASPHVILDVKPNGDVEFMTRTTMSAETMYVAGASPGLPAWLRLTRSGSSITGAVSTDGSTWTEIGSVSSVPAGAAYGGLAVTSHDPTVLNQSVFDNVFANAPPAPWLSQDVGSVGTAGRTAYANGVFTISGAGSDIWDTADAFRFLYQPMTDPHSSIEARVVSEQDTSPFAKAGVMIRSSLAPDAVFVILDMKPDGGIEFMQRPAQGEAVTYLGGSTGGPGTWLRLVRTSGPAMGTDTVRAEMSGDGVTWTAIGNTTVDGALTAELGVAVTSHDPSQLNMAVADRVLIMRQP